MTVDGSMKTGVMPRIRGAGKLLGGMKRLFKCSSLGMNVKRTALYGIEGGGEISEEYVWSNTDGTNNQE